MSCAAMLLLPGFVKVVMTNGCASLFLRLQNEDERDDGQDRGARAPTNLCAEIFSPYSGFCEAERLFAVDPNGVLVDCVPLVTGSSHCSFRYLLTFRCPRDFGWSLPKRCLLCVVHLECRDLVFYTQPADLQMYGAFIRRVPSFEHVSSDFVGHLSNVDNV